MQWSRLQKKAFQVRRKRVARLDTFFSIQEIEIDLCVGADNMQHCQLEQKSLGLYSSKKGQTAVKEISNDPKTTLKRP